MTYMLNTQHSRLSPLRLGLITITSFIFLLISSLVIYQHRQEQYASSSPSSLFIRFISFSSLGGSNAMAVASPKNGRTNKPKLIFHVGPPKMASTTIQIGALQRYENILLQHDNFIAYGFKETSDLNQCLNTNVAHCQSMGREWSHFKSFIDDAIQHGHNVLLSTENFWGGIATQRAVDLPRVYADVLRPLFEVIIVISYRRFFEYWPSAYYQNFFLKCGFGRKRNGARIPSMKEFLNVQNNTEQGLYHPTAAQLDRFSQWFPRESIRIFNIHPEHLVSRFLCDVANATNACSQSLIDEKIDNSTTMETHYNTKHSLYYDRLAQAARQSDLLHNITQNGKRPMIIQCKNIRDKIQRHQEEDLNATSYDLPLACLTPLQQSWLQQTSWKHEETLLLSNLTVSPEPSSGILRQKERHNEAFDRMVNSSYCDVDVEAVLRDEQWRAFLLNCSHF